MSKATFLQNVRVARSLLTHRVNTDDPRLDPEKVEGQLARAAIWLTRSAVKGFDVRDFAELSIDRRRELGEFVEQFLRVAKEVPGNGPATSEQIRNGMAAFREILKILEPYFSESEESKRIRGALGRVSFPDIVVNWNFKVGEDWTGDPAVWIYVFVKDEAADDSRLTMETTKIEDRIQTALADAGIARRPDVRFRTASEQRSLENIAT